MKVFCEIPFREEEYEYRVQSLLYKCYKFQIMWALRSLEERIRTEDGSIFIDQHIENKKKYPLIRFEGFSSTLEDEIRGLLLSMKYETV